MKEDQKHMRIDSHQHFWSYSAGEYPWITEKLKRIRADFLPQDLERELTPAQIEGSIAVQARQSIEESRWLLNLADHYASIKGVVGWVDLRSPRVGEQLAELSKHPRFVGVRHVVQDEPDEDFMGRADFVRGIGELKRFPVAYDLLIYPVQLPAATQLARKFPKQTFVLDHIAKPLIREGIRSLWEEQIRELAKCSNVFCKISGMVTEAKWGEWNPEDFRPYLDIVFECFGVDRLMYGSDWPVCLVAGNYQPVYRLAHDYVVKNAPKAEAKIFGGNAVRAYRLKR
jgi:L-fuconolactonase